MLAQILFITLITFCSSFVSAGPLGARIEDWQKWRLVSLHNEHRFLHGAAPLNWNEDLATRASNWIGGCQVDHYSGDRSLGENIIAGSGRFGVSDAFEAFIGDRDTYNRDEGSYLHWTQVVWKSTTEIGCAVQRCPNLFDGRTDGTIYACLYNPQGNIQGQARDNVQP